jgi:hypothetical protein
MFKRIKLSNLKALAVVALPIFIAVCGNAGAQSVPGSSRITRSRVSGGVITVVNINGNAIRTSDGGQSWEALDAATTQNVTSNLQQTIARREVLAQATTTGATASPNPTNGATTINYEIAQPGEVLLTVFDAHGIEVLHRSEGTRQLGANSTAFDATRYSSGVYYYRIMIDGAIAGTGKVIVAR